MSDALENTEDKGAKKGKEAKVMAIDAKAYLKDQKGKKIKYTDRKSVEIIAATKHYTVGQIVSPHKTFAEYLIKQKIAKEYKAQETEESED